MTIENEPHSESNVGIAFDLLTPDVFADIVHIYFELAGGKEYSLIQNNPEAYARRVQELYTTLQAELDPDAEYTQGRHYGMRVGSRLNDNSKLEFNIVNRFKLTPTYQDQRIFRVTFNPNGTGGDDAVQLTASINVAISQYLRDKGLAIPLN